MMTVILLINLLIVKSVLGNESCAYNNITVPVGSDVNIPLIYTPWVQGYRSIFEVHQGVTSMVARFRYHQTYSFDECSVAVIVPGKFELLCTEDGSSVRMKSATEEESGLYLLTEGLDVGEPFWFHLFYITVGRKTQEMPMNVTSVYIKRGKSLSFPSQNIWWTCWKNYLGGCQFGSMVSKQTILENKCYISWNRTFLKMFDFIPFDPVNIKIVISDDKVTCVPEDKNTNCTFKLEIQDNATSHAVIGRYSNKLRLPILKDSNVVCTSCTDQDGEIIDGSMATRTYIKFNAKLVFPPANQINYVTLSVNVAVSILIFSNLKIDEVTLYGVVNGKTQEMKISNMVWKIVYLKISPKSVFESKVSSLMFQLEVNQSIEYYILLARNQLVENSFKFTVKVNAIIVFPPSNQIHYLASNNTVTVNILIFSNLEIEEVTLFGVAHGEPRVINMSNIVWNEQYLKMTPKSSFESNVSKLNFQLEVNQSIENYFLVARNQLVENSFKFTVKVKDKKFMCPKKDLPVNIFHASLFGNLVLGVCLILTISCCIIRYFSRRKRKKYITNDHNTDPYHQYDEIGTLYGGSMFCNQQNIQTIENGGQRQSSEQIQGQTVVQLVQHSEVTRRDVHGVSVLKTREGNFVQNQTNLQSVRRHSYSSQTNLKTIVCQENKHSTATEINSDLRKDSQIRFPIYFTPSDSNPSNQKTLHCDNEEIEIEERDGYLVTTPFSSPNDLNQSASKINKTQHALLGGYGEITLQEKNGYLFTKSPSSSRNYSSQNTSHNSKTSTQDNSNALLNVAVQQLPTHDIVVDTIPSDNHEHLENRYSFKRYISMEECAEKNRQSANFVDTDNTKTDNWSKDKFSVSMVSDKNENKCKKIDKERSFDKNNVSIEHDNEGTEGQIAMSMVSHEDEIKNMEIKNQLLLTGSDIAMEDKNDESSSRHPSNCSDVLMDIKNEDTKSLSENSDRIYLSLLSERNEDRPYASGNDSEKETHQDNT